MKRKMWALAVLLMFSGLAAAQLMSNSRIATQVPFEFVAANKIIPAGECVVQVTKIDPTILTMRNASSKVGVFLPTSLDENKKAANSYALVFKRYGNQYFLSAIKLEGSKIAYRVPESKAEAELRAQNVPATDKIVLAYLK